jgi:hypothetical protein
MEALTIEFSPDNPCRPPCWRWHYARYRAENGLGIPPRDEGPWVRRAFRFHQVLLKYDRPDAVDRLLAWRPELVFAYELWCNTNSLARDVVEACILSGQTSAQIARKLCFHWEGLDAYAELFYDVREKLRHRAYVSAVLIGPALSGPLSRVTFPAVLKAFGYHMGPHVVDALLGVYNASVAPLEPEGIHLALGAMRDLDLIVKAAVAIKLLPINERTASHLWRLHARILKLETKMAKKPDAHQEVRAGVDRMLREFQRVFADHLDAAPDWLKRFLQNTA